MVPDKYIGLALAVSGTLAIGSSFIITKKVRRLDLHLRWRLNSLLFRDLTMQTNETGPMDRRLQIILLIFEIQHGGQEYRHVSCLAIVIQTHFLTWCASASDSGRR